MMRWLIVVLLFGVTSCNFSLGVSADTKQYFVLTNVGNAEANQTVLKRSKRLVIREAVAPYFYDSQRIVFSKDPSTRGYYQFAYWADAPAKRLTSLLLDEFEKVNLFETVTTQQSATTGDLQLNPEIIDFYHDIENRPGQVVVTIRIELVDFHSRTILASKVFSERVESKQYRAEGAVAAFNIALGRVLTEIIVWIDREV